ncbi:MAG TPA: sigma-70 family RNA polymerase sigma factor [Candidatus Binatia bacterium]|nr:sigma-70 family RNA polymerase sigma factor [Candidatus Binatia bacterium]
MSASLVSQNQDTFLPTRPTLLARLKNVHDQESWNDFFNTYWKLIHGVAIKSGLAEEEAKDVVQETLISVSKAIEQFEYNPEVCSFKTWLRTIIRRRIADQFRKRPRESLADDSPQSLETTTSALEKLPSPESDAPDAVWEAEWQKTVIDVALERLKRQLSAEHYQIFYLNVIKQLTPRDVAKSLNVSVGRVYLVKHRHLRSFAKSIKDLQAKLV